MNLIDLLGWIIAFVVAITVHEAAHAWMADRLGDPTARLMGRLSLNPIVHYDPVGTTMLLLLVFMRAITQNPSIVPFGWAKPVRFDPYNLQNPRKDSALISLAGPISNILLSTILAIFVRLFIGPLNALSILNFIFIPTIVLNVSLAIFNLIPIHPLDGGKIFVGLLPEKDAHEADMFLTRYGTLILIFLLFPIAGVAPISAVISPLINFVLSILLPSALFS